MLLFRDALYRQATAQEFARVLQEILDRHAQKFKASTPNRYKDTDLFAQSQAVARDLNAAVHLEYEIYTNLFGASDYAKYGNSVLFIDAFRMKGPQLTYRWADQWWMLGNTKVSGDVLAKKIDMAIKREDETIQNRARAFLQALMTYVTNWGFKATISDNFTEFEIDGVYVSLSYKSPTKLYIELIAAYEAQKGSGSKILKLVTDLADTFCVTLVGEPYALDLKWSVPVPEIRRRPNVSDQKLKDLYRRFGFDVTEFRGMRRKPNC